MVINFVVNPVVGGWTPTDTRLGGTEDSVVRWAVELMQRGHEVKIYHNDHTGDNYDEYKPGDVCINVKHHGFKTKEPTLYLTNEVDAGVHDLSGYRGVILPTQWAVDNIPTNAQKTFILPYGYDSEAVYSGNKVRYQCFYGSSPDRGLDTLLTIWPAIYEKHSRATLIITYGASTGYLPGVINLGNVDEETMNDIYRSSDFWCHPCNGGELYCITGIKAQAAGCIPVIIPRMALSETVHGGFHAANEANYFDALDAALSSSDEDIFKLRQELVSEHYPNWEDTTDELERIIDSVLG